MKEDKFKEIQNISKSIVDSFFSSSMPLHKEELDLILEFSRKEIEYKLGLNKPKFNGW